MPGKFIVMGFYPSVISQNQILSSVPMSSKKTWYPWWEKETSTDCHSIFENHSERKNHTISLGPGTDWIHKKRHKPNCSSLVHGKLSLLLLKPYAVGKRTGFVFTLTFVLKNVNVLNASMCLTVIWKFKK
jgi:hypothetical protein